uniref:Uncharacterized protein n=1 Tax=Anguilla anguilla TaxID=7936 RepID=A0A0E9Q0D4_ANGAN
MYSKCDQKHCYYYAALTLCSLPNILMSCIKFGGAGYLR